MRKLEAESVRKMLHRRRMRMREGTGKGSFVGTGELWLSSALAIEKRKVKGSQFPRRTISVGSFPEYVCVRATTSYPTAPRQSTAGAFNYNSKSSHSSRKATVRCSSRVASVQGTFRS